MTNNILEELKKEPIYQKSLEKMSDEEKRLVEQALEKTLTHFEETIINPLKNLKPR